MMNAIKFGVAALILVACSAGYEDQDDNGIDLEGDEVELGTAEQALANVGPNYGVTVPGSHLACNKTSTGQQCTVPAFTAIKYCYGNGITATQANSFDLELNSVKTSQTKFVFTRVFAGNSANCEAASVVNANLKIRAGVCPGASTGTSVENFVCLGLDNAGLLTESVPGTWQKHTLGAISVDFADLEAHGGPGCVVGHGLRHAAANFIGLGSNNPVYAADTTGSFATQRSINPETQFGLCGHAQLHSQEICEANLYTNTSPTTWAFSTVNCP